MMSCHLGYFCQTPCTWNKKSKEFQCKTTESSSALCSSKVGITVRGKIARKTATLTDILTTGATLKEAGTTVASTWEWKVGTIYNALLTKPN